DFDSVSETEFGAKLACIAMSVVSSCGVTLGVPPPAVAAAAAGATGCAITAAAASAIMCQQSRDCCLAAATMATGVATAQVDEKGEETRMCCSCTRETWHNRSWRSDVLLKSAPWGSVVTDTDRPVSECEGREGKLFYAAAPDQSGRWTYY